MWSLYLKDLLRVKLQVTFIHSLPQPMIPEEFVIAGAKLGLCVLLHAESALDGRRVENGRDLWL